MRMRKPAAARRATTTSSRGRDTRRARAAAGRTSSEKLLCSAVAQAVKAEIVAVGRKLWQREYVDGNGGNISCRIGENAVICTPTLLSKADLRPQDLCLVDLAGAQLAGSRPRTSEILLHLEIYKAVREARAVVHCHPPHATAYAIAGCLPPTGIIPEYEVFVGRVALSPYETPGTQAFAETVLPYVRGHNAVLLGNHGLVCWADTVTHAEWYAEIVDAYCRTLAIAAQLGLPVASIPQEKVAALLAIRNRLGLPIASTDDHAGETQPRVQQLGAKQVEAVVRAVTDAVLAALRR